MSRRWVAWTNFWLFLISCVVLVLCLAADPARAQQKIAIRAENGLYLQANGHLAEARSSDPVYFDLEVIGQGRVALKLQGRYLRGGADRENHLGFGSGARGGWETFELADLGNQRFALRSVQSGGWVRSSSVAKLLPDEIYRFTADGRIDIRAVFVRLPQFNMIPMQKVPVPDATARMPQPGTGPVQLVPSPGTRATQIPPQLLQPGTRQQPVPPIEPIIGVLGTLAGPRDIHEGGPANAVLKTERLYLPGHRSATTVTYAVIGGQAIFEGDIVLGPAHNLSHLKTPPAKPVSPGTSPGIGMKQSQLVSRGDEHLWPGGVIPYEIDPSLPSALQTTIRDGVKMLEDQLPVHFLPRRNGDPNWIRFVLETGGPCGRSPVGMVGGQQNVQIANGCGTDTVMHEVLHSLGFWHEQSRADRDAYVEIVDANINEYLKNQHNFTRHDDSEAYGDYDYNSIMHYSATAFGKVDAKTKAKATTIRSKVAGKTIAPGLDLTQTDKDGVRVFYPDVACSRNAELFERAGYDGRRLRITRNEPALGALKFDDTASSLCVPTGTTLTLFQHPNYGGARIQVSGPAYIGNLATQSPDGGNWIGQISSLQITGGAVSSNHPPSSCKTEAALFRHASYGGEKLALTGSVPHLGAVQFDDKASAVCLPVGWKVTLWEHPNYQGRGITLTGPVAYPNIHRDLGEDWGDRVSSVSVDVQHTITGCPNGPLLYEHANYGGHQLQLLQKYPNLHAAWVNFGDRASAICVPRGWVVVLYEHVNYAGQSLRFDGPIMIPNLSATGWNDVPSSVNVVYSAAGFD